MAISVAANRVRRAGLRRLRGRRCPSVIQDWKPSTPTSARRNKTCHRAAAQGWMRKDMGGRD